MKAKTPDRLISNADTQLVRAVGIKGIVALTINSIIGAGIFALPATIAAILGNASFIAFLGAGLFTIFIVLCFAELGGRFDRTGGAYLYASEAFGGITAFLVGWVYFLARMTSFAALTAALIGFIGYFVELVFPLRELVIICLCSLLGFINYLGIKNSSRFINFFTIAKLGPLFVLIVAGLLTMNLEAYKNIHLPSLEPLTKALLLCIFGFTGFEQVTVPAAEMTNAKRDVPKAILIGTGITIVVYFLIQFVAGAIHPQLASSKRPLAETAQMIMGIKGGILLTLGAIFSVTGNIMGSMLTAPRIIFAMSEQQQLPQIFAKIHPVFRTPFVSIIFFTLLVITVTISSGFVNLATLSAMARLITYVSSAVALIVLRRRLQSPDTFRIPGGNFVPIMTILISIFLLTAATTEQWTAGIIALAVGFLLYFATRKTVERNQKVSG
ncbi:MAG TPA: APC family permease [Acidobacteriota bacterium]|nr:APC family permease [Acidobacteriota bacterium]